jgi:hypothetical protein
MADGTEKKDRSHQFPDGQKDAPAHRDSGRFPYDPQYDRILEVMQLDPEQIAQNVAENHTQIRERVARLERINELIAGKGHAAQAPSLDFSGAKLDELVARVEEYAKKNQPLKKKLEKARNGGVRVEYDKEVLDAQLDEIEEVVAESLSAGHEAAALAEQTGRIQEGAFTELIEVLSNPRLQRLLDKDQKVALAVALDNLNENPERGMMVAFPTIQWIFLDAQETGGMGNKLGSMLSHSFLGSGREKDDLFDQVRSKFLVWREAKNAHLTAEQYSDYFASSVGKNTMENLRNNLFRWVEKSSRKALHWDLLRQHDHKLYFHIDGQVGNAIVEDSKQYVESNYQQDEMRLASVQLSVPTHFSVGFTQNHMAELFTRSVMNKAYLTWLEKIRDSVGQYAALYEELGLQGVLLDLGRESVKLPPPDMDNDKLYSIPPHYIDVLADHPLYPMAEYEMGQLREMIAKELDFFQDHKLSRADDEEKVSRFATRYVNQLVPDMAAFPVLLKTASEIFTRYFDAGEGQEKYRWINVGKNLTNILATWVRYIYASGDPQQIEQLEQQFTALPHILLEALQVYSSRDRLVAEDSSGGMYTTEQYDLYRESDVLLRIEQSDPLDRIAAFRSILEPKKKGLVMGAEGRAPRLEEVDNSFKGESVIMGLLLKQELLRPDSSPEILEYIYAYITRSNWRYDKDHPTAAMVISMKHEGYSIDSFIATSLQRRFVDESPEQITHALELLNPAAEVGESEVDKSKMRMFLELSKSSYSLDSFISILEKSQGVRARVAQASAGVEAYKVDEEAIQGVIGHFYSEEGALKDLIEKQKSFDPESEEFQTAQMLIDSLLHKKGLRGVLKEADSANKIFLDFYFDKSLINFSKEKPKVWQRFLESGLSNVLFQETQQPLAKFFLSRLSLLIEDESDIGFLTQVYGEHGAKSKNILQGYLNCLKEKKIDKRERYLILDFAREFRVVTPNIIAGYKLAREAGPEQTRIFFATLNDLSDRLISRLPLTAEQRNSSYYRELIEAKFPNNAGGYTDYENNNSADDRVHDLDRFKIRDRYTITTGTAKEVKVKDDQKIESVVKGLEVIQTDVKWVNGLVQEAGYDVKKLAVKLNELLDEQLAEFQKGPRGNVIDISQLRSVTDKIFFLNLEHLYGDGSVSQDFLKRAIMLYEFTYVDNIKPYFEGTGARVENSSHKEYALLLEMHELYSDKLKETIRKIGDEVKAEGSLSAQLERYYREIAQESLRQQVASFETEKMGINPGLLSQVRKTLEKGRPGRIYSEERVVRLIQRIIQLEKQDQLKDAKDPRAKAFIGQVSKQLRDQTKLLRTLGVDPESTQGLLATEEIKKIVADRNATWSGAYNAEEFISYVGAELKSVFIPELEQIEEELDKYEIIETADAAPARKIFGYISKTKESAHARQVAGVCVCGDNPQKSGVENQWDQPNFAQMVYDDPEAGECVGLSMMHDFDQGDGKTLVVSMNPSSTFLFTVDEAAFFWESLNELVEFAKDNNFSRVTLSAQREIRTNRTGGQFEAAMNEAVRNVNKKYKLKEEKIFSYNPVYKLQELDVVWEAPVVVPPAEEAVAA